MSTIDRVRERIAYLKLWLGIFVVTTISLIGWLVSNYKKVELFWVVLDALAILTLVVVIAIMHSAINRKIEDLEDL